MLKVIIKFKLNHNYVVFFYINYIFVFYLCLITTMYLLKNFAGTCIRYGLFI